MISPTNVKPVRRLAILLSALLVLLPASFASKDRSQNKASDTLRAKLNSDKKPRSTWRSEMLTELLTQPEAIKVRVEKALKKYFKDPEEMEFEFFPTPKNKLALGFFSRIDVKVKNSKVKVLKVKEGTFSFRGLVLKLTNLYRDGDVRIKELENTKFDFVVTEQSINEAIAEKKLPLKNPRLKINLGQLYFKGSFRTLFFKSHVETKGRLEVKNKTHVYFYPDRLKLNSLPIPGFVKKSLSKKINPIINLDKFDFIKSIDSIQLMQGYIRFKG